MSHDTAGQLTAAASKALKTSGGATLGPFVVDASALEQFDSSALAVLLDCHRQAVAAGRTLAVIGMPGRLIQLATLYGVAPLIFGTPAESASPT